MKHEGTEKEIQDRIDAGMELISKHELYSRLETLNYKVSLSPMTFNYFNSSNKNHYNAKSVHITDEATGHGFANIAANKKNLAALQAIRFNCFVVDNNRIWDL